MKTVSESLFIDVFTDCPECGETINLMDIQSLRDDDVLLGAVLGHNSFGLGCKDLDEEVECPYCNKEFRVGEIIW